MDELIQFFAKFGLPITLIAFAGIAILGIMKYCNLFTGLKEQTRHFVYVGISAGLSIIGSIIYLLIVGQFELNFIVAIAFAIYALNQTWYNIFKVTSFNDLMTKLLTKIIDFINAHSKE